MKLDILAWSLVLAHTNHFHQTKYSNSALASAKTKVGLWSLCFVIWALKHTPVLINSICGESLHQLLPLPKVFDHVVVKVIDSTNANLFYDPTISNQFGDYKSVSFPNYGKALVIKKGVKSLENIRSKSNNLIEVFDTFDIPTVEGPSTLNVMTVYRDAEADAMRTRYKSSSLSSVSKDFKNFYENIYDGVDVIKDPIFDDDSLANKILVEESYKINNIWTPIAADDQNIAVEFSPYSILDVFISPAEKERETPFTLYYPTGKKHKITVKLPKRLRITNDNISVTSESFDFSMKTKMNPAKDILYLNYEYQNKNSFVKAGDFNEFYKKIKEVEQIMAYYVYLPKSKSKNTNFNSPLNTATLVSNATILFYWIIGIIAVVGIGLVIFVIKSSKNKN